MDGEFIHQDLLGGLELMAKLKVVYSPDYTNSGRGRDPTCCRSYYVGQVNNAKLLCRSIDELLKKETQSPDKLKLNGFVKLVFENKFFGRKFLIEVEKMSRAAETDDREGFDKAFEQFKADMELLEEKLKAYFELLDKLAKYKYVDDKMLLGTCPQLDWPQEVGCSHQDIMLGFTGLGKTPSQSSGSDGNEENVEC